MTDKKRIKIANELEERFAYLGAKTWCEKTSEGIIKNLHVHIGNHRSSYLTIRLHWIDLYQLDPSDYSMIYDYCCKHRFPLGRLP